MEEIDGMCLLTCDGGSFMTQNRCISCDFCDFCEAECLNCSKC